MKAGVVAYPPGGWHAQLGSFFCDLPELYAFNKQNGNFDNEAIRENDRRYIENLNRWLLDAPACNNLVFSYEGFVDLDENALRRFKLFCESLAVTAVVVLYIRPPLSYAISAMSQSVKQGRLSLNNNEPVIWPYKDIIIKLINVFGKDAICIKVFSKGILKNSNVVDDFLEFLDIPIEIYKRLEIGAEVVNKSLSSTALAFGERFIEALALRGWEYSEKQFLEKYGRYLSTIPGSPIKLTAKQIARVSLLSHPHMDFLNEQFGISIHEDSESFLQNVSADKYDLDMLLSSFGDFLGDVITHGRQHRSDFSVADLTLLRAKLRCGSNVYHGQILDFEVAFSIAKAVDELEIGIHIFDNMGNWVFGTNTTLLGKSLNSVGRGTYTMHYHLVADLPEGDFTAGFAFAERFSGRSCDLAWYDKLIPFHVVWPEARASVGYANLPVSFDCVKTGDAVIGIVEDATGSLSVISEIGNLETGESFELIVRLNNASTQSWMNDCGALLSTKKPINLSYHWIDSSGDVFVFEGHRTLLPVLELRSGETLLAAIRVFAPSISGHYRLKLLPVQESCCWFDDRGFIPCVLEVDVVQARAKRHYPGADTRLLSQVGRRDGLCMVSTGNEGFLVYGPYATVAAGTYLGCLYGFAESSTDEGWVDIVGDGGRELAKKNLSLKAGDGWSVELAFDLLTSVNDLELRVWVPVGAIISLHGLSFEFITNSDSNGMGHIINDNVVHECGSPLEISLAQREFPKRRRSKKKYKL